MKEYDLIVIGSGGGTKVSSPAAQLGYKVAIIEKGRLGGTCLNRGCIPSKMLIYPANVLTLMNDLKKFDIKVKVEGVNFGKIVKRVSATVDEQSDGIQRTYKNKNIKSLDYYDGHARFVDNNTVEVNGKKIKGKKILIATGARPLIPKIEGLEGTPYMTSTEALRGTTLPKKMVVIGGGYIATELGHAYGSYGTDVHMLVRSEMVKLEDKDVREEFVKEFSKRYKVHYTSPIKVEYQDKEFIVHTQDNKGKKKVIKADALLVASGVVPNTDKLGIDNTNIKLSKKGFVKVDNYMKTTVPHVYAIGDCVGNYMFRHSVNFEGEYLFGQLYGKDKKSSIRYLPIPHAIFSYPEVAGVGVTEDELIAKGMKKDQDYVSVIHKYIGSGMGMARISEHGFVKMLFDTQNRRLLGCHIIGEEAATMVHQAIYALTFKATVDDLLKMVYIHPALPEVFRNAARKGKAELDTFE
jgi:mycothione reductase